MRRLSKPPAHWTGWKGSQVSSAQTFIGLPRNKTQITLEKIAMNVPEEFPYGGDTLVPLRAGASVPWSLST